jgi:hypothetical protein
LLTQVPMARLVKDADTCRRHGLIDPT